MHALGAERLCGEGGGERRVDSAGDPEDDIVEAVLRHVVAEAELEGAPHLLELVEGGGEHGLHGPARRVLGHVDDRRIGELPARACERAAPCVAETAADRGGRVHVHDEERLLERGPSGDDLPLLVEDEAVPVEDELVLGADGVHEHDPAGVVPRPRREHVLALGALAEVERRGRDVGDDVRAGEGEVGGRRAGLPDVLADRRPDQRLAAAQEDELAPRLEVAVLVEDAVVRKELLVVDRLDLAVHADSARVEEVAVEMRRPDECGDPLRLRRDRLERLGRRAQEARPKKQVLGRIAGHGQLGEEDELGAGLSGFAEPLDDARAVAVEVADDRVHLRERKSHASDSTGLRLRDEN